MYRYYKILWMFRALVYKFAFARFGFYSYIGKPIFLMGVRKFFFGRRVRIFPGLRAECHGKGRLFIHDNVSIGQGFHVTCLGDIHIGAGSHITGYVSVTDIEHEYFRVGIPVFDQPMTRRETKIGRNCFIGMGARIQAGSVLGDGCVVGANSVVRGTFPAYSVIVGSPARVVKRYNSVSGEWERC